jgi:hypothetical protein
MLVPVQLLQKFPTPLAREGKLGPRIRKFHLEQNVDGVVLVC